MDVASKAGPTSLHSLLDSTAGRDSSSSPSIYRLANPRIKSRFFKMWYSTLTALLLVSQVFAGVISDAAYMVRRSSGEDRMRRSADRLVETLERRQSATTVNIATWDADTMAACIASLEALKGVATNPSGMAVCYNLPMLDEKSGVFQADLRLFKISEPTGIFGNISSQNIQVGLSYDGATVSTMDSSQFGTRGEHGTLLISTPQKRQAVEPVMAQAYAFVGQINADLLTSSMGT